MSKYVISRSTPWSERCGGPSNPEPKSDEFGENADRTQTVRIRHGTEETLLLEQTGFGKFYYCYRDLLLQRMFWKIMTIFMTLSHVVEYYSSHKVTKHCCYNNIITLIT